MVTACLRADLIWDSPIRTLFRLASVVILMLLIVLARVTKRGGAVAAILPRLYSFTKWPLVVSTQELNIVLERPN